MDGRSDHGECLARRRLLPSRAGHWAFNRRSHRDRAL